MIRQFILSGCFLFLFSLVSAQSFGIRAGLNYTKFSGPLEQGVNETNTLSNGFHFGVNYAYKFADRLSVKGELLYTQIGTKYAYNGESFYKIPIGSGFVYEKGNSQIEMKVSNAYIALPITVQFELSKKIELNIGVYGGFLIGPKGNGTIRFDSYEHPEGITFRQSLLHSYNSDVARQNLDFPGTTGPKIFVDGGVVPLSRNTGAYYAYDANEKVGNLYNRYDFGLTGGLSYFINKGFYFGVRYDFGLLDITNNKVDHKRKTYDEVNNLFNFTDDFDRNVGIQASFGFKF